MEEDRNLTEADVRAIVTLLWKEIARDFYAKAGEGFIALVKKGAIFLMILLALYGMLGDKTLLRHVAEASGGPR